jgi:hypothetical protein
MLITRIFRTTPPCLSRGAFHPPRRTAVTFRAFPALFFARTPTSGGSARTSLDSAKNKPDLTTFRKQRTWRPRRRIIYGIASLPADLVRLVRLIRNFLQRTIPDSAPNRHPGQSFRPSPAALSNLVRPTAGAFCAFCALFALFCSGTAERGLRQNELRLRQKQYGLGHLQQTKGSGTAATPPGSPRCVQKSG